MVSFILKGLLNFIIRALMKEAASELNKALKTEEQVSKLESKIEATRKKVAEKTDKAAQVQNLVNKLKTATESVNLNEIREQKVNQEEGK
ncbi:MULTISPECIES: hypothetical protein [unclassified Vibrio]|uniref:Uncharacterized protein n=1 Tax=Vibrio sp. HB236076 TaxID=3232307 RepID=A0AB39HAP0_9VIBR|nr:hypothetical protein [Vibrio sp. HB161653]MDP5253350.1 hypothetical protein [Vibrio sp. HB161653]